MAEFDFDYKVKDNNSSIGLKFISGGSYYNIYQALRKTGNVKIVTCGSMRQIWYSDGSIKTYFIRGFNFQGTHLCHYVRKDVEKRIESGEFQIKYDLDAFKNLYIYTSLFNFWNLQGINSAQLLHNGFIKAVDINYCYWNTLYRIGAIGDHVYKMGLKKKKEWKLARNMAVGTLSKKHIVQIISENGKIETVMHQSELTGARLEVVAYIYEISVAIAKKLGNKFCFFFTDCFFVHPDVVDETMAMLREFGFESKVSNDRILDIKKRAEFSYEMEWERLERQKENNGKRVIVKNTFNTKTLLRRLPEYVIENGKSILQDPTTQN